MAKAKKSTEVVCTIDVRGLTDEDVRVLNELAEFLRRKAARRKAVIAKEDIPFGSWPLGAKGELTRREIYDHL
jgi:transcriptional regulator GlxA family with amidase domain